MTIADQRIALFKGATSTNWVGSLQAYYFDRDCVPLLVDGRRFGLEFTVPAHNKDEPYLEQMPYRDAVGAPFFPVRDHRVLTLWILDESNNINAFCCTYSENQSSATARLANAIWDAFGKYFHSHPHITQYFYYADAGFASFLQTEVLGQPPAGVNIVPLAELAPPYYGFVATEHRSAK